APATSGWPRRCRWGGWAAACRRSLSVDRNPYEVRGHESLREAPGVSPTHAFAANALHPGAEGVCGESMRPSATEQAPGSRPSSCPVMTRKYVSPDNPRAAGGAAPPGPVCRAGGGGPMSTTPQAPPPAKAPNGAPHPEVDGIREKLAGLG